MTLKSRWVRFWALMREDYRYIFYPTLIFLNVFLLTELEANTKTYIASFISILIFQLYIMFFINKEKDIYIKNVVPRLIKSFDMRITKSNNPIFRNDHLNEEKWVAFLFISLPFTLAASGSMGFAIERSEEFIIPFFCFIIHILTTAWSIARRSDLRPEAYSRHGDLLSDEKTPHERPDTASDGREHTEESRDDNSEDTNFINYKNSIVILLFSVFIIIATPIAFYFHEDAQVDDLYVKYIISFFIAYVYSMFLVWLYGITAPSNFFWKFIGGYSAFSFLVILSLISYRSMINESLSFIDNIDKNFDLCFWPTKVLLFTVFLFVIPSRFIKI